MIALEEDPRDPTTSSLIWGIGFVALGQVLVLIIVLENVGRGPEGRLATVVAILELGFVVALDACSSSGNPTGAITDIAAVRGLRPDRPGRVSVRQGR